MSKDNGGQAFPAGAETEVAHSEFGPHESPTGNRPGMTLRDWFAGQALMGILSYGTIKESQLRDDEIGKDTGIVATGRAYQYADAMLAERNKE